MRRCSCSLRTPGMSATSRMPPASSITSTGGMRAGSRSLAERSCCGARSTTCVLLSMINLLHLLDVDATRLCRFAALHADAQHAVAILGGDAGRIDVVRQADDAPEAAAEALVDVHRLLLVAFHLTNRTLAGHRQHAAVEVHFHLRGIDAGRECIDLYGRGRAAHVDGRKA